MKTYYDTMTYYDIRTREQENLYKSTEVHLSKAILYEVLLTADLLSSRKGKGLVNSAHVKQTKGKNKWHIKLNSPQSFIQSNVTCG